jgi:UDP-glucose 4-epimerase
MTIGIVGATGFIGRSLLKHFACLGRPAIAISRRPLTDDCSRYAAASVLLEDPSCDSTLSQLDYAVICTGSMLPSDSITVEQLQSSAQEAVILKRCVSRVKKGVIFVSSGGAVYGNTPKVPVDETIECQPISVYGKYKLAQELEAMELCEKHQTNLLIARLSNPYGPLQTAIKGQGLIARLRHCSQTGEEFILWGDGLAVRDYIHIDDFCDFIDQAAVKGASGIYNVGSGKGHSVQNILTLFNLIKSDCNITINRVPARQCDVSKIILDIAKATTDLGWAPRRDLRTGLTDLLTS